MKKTIIALSRRFVASVQAAPQANTFYAGAKSRFGHLSTVLINFEDSCTKARNGS